MDVRPIRTEQDYDWALAEISRYFENEPRVGTPDGDRFEVLLTLLAAYEDKHYPMPEVDALQMLRYVMELRGKTQADLSRVIGSRSRASEVLAGKRALTLDTIARLHHEWGIPSDLLLPRPRNAAA
ncbi:MAG: helix-turn-helix domain-containing protein [Rhizobiaceae bacterium]|nr:helix-turn-helix domain-containing protein [Rhizobiaceae bacterium]